MVTFAQAQERGEEWVNAEVPAYQHREVRVREFALGFVVWAEDRAEGPRSDGGAQRLVIARDGGEVTLWPGLPVGEVIRRFEEEYGAQAAVEPVSSVPERIDLHQTSFLLSPPEWLQEAADKLGIPDRRGTERRVPVRPAGARRVPPVRVARVRRVRRVPGVRWTRVRVRVCPGAVPLVRPVVPVPGCRVVPRRPGHRRRARRAGRVFRLRPAVRLPLVPRLCLVRLVFRVCPLRGCRGSRGDVAGAGAVAEDDRRARRGYGGPGGCVARCRV